MNILIAYATFSSGTMEASEFIAQLIRDKGHIVNLKKIAETHPDEFNEYDLVMLGSPSWLVNNTEGMPHDDFVNFFKLAEGKVYEQKKFVIYGLGDASYAHFCGAVDHIEEFVHKMKGNIVTESLRIDGYLMDEKNAQDHIKTWIDNVLSKLS